MSDLPSAGTLRFASSPSLGNIGAPLDVDGENEREFDRELYDIEEVDEDDAWGFSGTIHEPGDVEEYRAVPVEDGDEDKDHHVETSV